jgi:hypothetical protein
MGILNQKNIGRFLKALDQATISTNTRYQQRSNLRAFHVLQETPSTLGVSEKGIYIGEAAMTRLAATDGHILAICDIPTDLLDFACGITPPLLYKKEFEGKRCYVTPKKIENLSSKILFPAPMIDRVISFDNIERLSPSSSSIFGIDDLQRYASIRNAYMDNDRVNEIKVFNPSYKIKTKASGEEWRCGKIWVDEGIMILIMPRNPLNPINYTPNNAPPINMLLPGLLPDSIVSTCPICKKLNESSINAPVVICNNPNCPPYIPNGEK